MTSSCDEEMNYQEQLEKHHLEITRNLDLDRQYILSHLRSKLILDDEDCQLIKAGVSRQQKASKFIDVLMTKGPNGFTYFIEALEIEHPHLYEMITGNKPVGQNGNSYEQPVASWVVMTEKAVMDFDREFLVQELKKHCDTNRKMTYAHEKIIREKMTMEKKLDEITRERDDLFDDLHLALERCELNGEETSSHQDDVRNYIQQIQELLRVNFERSSIIIRLQSKLLEANEMFNVCKKNNEELRRKNENLMQQVRDLTINYDFQRTQSKRLSEQVNQNKCELNRVATTKREFLALKFELARMKEEKDAVFHELDEFKEVAAAMNVKCDILQKEKTNEEEKRGEISCGFKKLQEKVKQLEVLLHDERNKTDMFHRKNDRLIQEVDTHKEQCDFYITEREHAIRERNQMIRERDDAMRVNCELQKSRDETIQKHISIIALYDKQTIALAKELERTTEELKEWQMKAWNLIKEKEESEANTTLKSADDAMKGTSTEDVTIDIYLDLKKKLDGWAKRRNSKILKSSYDKLRALDYSELNRQFSNTLQAGAKTPEEEILASISFVQPPVQPAKHRSCSAGLFYHDDTTVYGDVTGATEKSGEDPVNSSTTSNREEENNNRDKPKISVTQSSSHPRLSRKFATDQTRGWIVVSFPSTINSNKNEMPELSQNQVNPYNATINTENNALLNKKVRTLQRY